MQLVRYLVLGAAACLPAPVGASVQFDAGVISRHAAAGVSSSNGASEGASDSDSGADSALSVLSLEASIVHLLRNFTRLPTNITAQQEAGLVNTIEDQVEMLRARVAKVKSNDQDDKAPDHVAKMVNLRAGLNSKQRADVDDMLAWRARRNHNMYLHGQDFMSKLENVLHLVKKGALRGDKDANGRLENALNHLEGLTTQGKKELKHYDCNQAVVAVAADLAQPPKAQPPKAQPPKAQPPKATSK